MIDLAAISDNLERSSDGTWVSRTRTEISYPEEGNFNCLALEADSFWFVHRNHCIQALMQRWQPSGAVFDIGGGNGYVAAGLQEAGIPVVLVEPGWEGVQSARERGVRTLVCAALEDARFHANSLPAVGLFDVLEHIQDDLGFLSTIYNLLQPGGYVYITVPAYSWLWSADDDYAGHHRRYTAKVLRHALTRAGFQVEYAGYIFFMLPPPIFLFRSIPSRLGLRKQNAWDRYQEEHRKQPGFTGRLLEDLLDMELGFIKRGRSVPFGGSCLVAARKNL